MQSYFILYANHFWSQEAKTVICVFVKLVEVIFIVMLSGIICVTAQLVNFVNRNMKFDRILMSDLHQQETVKSLGIIYILHTFQYFVVSIKQVHA